MYRYSAMHRKVEKLMGRATPFFHYFFKFVINKTYATISNRSKFSRFFAQSMTEQTVALRLAPDTGNSLSPEFDVYASLRGQINASNGVRDLPPVGSYGLEGKGGFVMPGAWIAAG